MMAAIVFLEQNGYEVIAPKGKMMRLALKIVLHKPSINNIARTLQKYSRMTERKPKSRVRAYLDKVFALMERHTGKN
jgi:RNA polymerase-interacting CarD/CdnL/TRCF family regulator